MPSAKLVIGGAAAGAAVGVRVARSLYGRWHVLPEPDRRRMEGLAEDLKHKALDLRGAPDAERAGADLRAANVSLAEALVETAVADPEVGADEVRDLRDELKRELERFAGGHIKASRTRHEASNPPG